MEFQEVLEDQKLLNFKTILNVFIVKVQFDVLCQQNSVSISLKSIECGSTLLNKIIHKLIVQLFPGKSPIIVLDLVPNKASALILDDSLKLDKHLCFSYASKTEHL